MGLLNSYHLILSDTLSRPAYINIGLSYTSVTLNIIFKEHTSRIFIVAATSEVIVLKHQLTCHTLNKTVCQSQSGFKQLSIKQRNYE